MFQNGHDEINNAAFLKGAAAFFNGYNKAFNTHHHADIHFGVGIE